MSSDDITHKKQILLALKRRLHERELQAANYGLNTDPIINRHYWKVLNLISYKYRISHTSEYMVSWCRLIRAMENIFHVIL